MDEKIFQDISRKLSIIMVLLARQNKDLTKNIDTAIDFLGGFVSNQDIAYMLNVNPRAVANARRNKDKTKNKLLKQ